MAEPVNSQVSGLQLSNNSFSASPPGSMRIALNGVIAQKGVFEAHRGHYAYAPDLAAYKPYALVEFEDYIVAQTMLSRTSATGKLGILDGTTINYISGTYSPLDLGTSGRMKFGFSGTFMNFCSNVQPWVMESIVSTPRAAGLPRMLSMYLSDTVRHGGTNEWMPYNSAVAYRPVLRKKLTDGTSLLSPPGSPFIVTNRAYLPIGALVRVANVVTATLAVGSDAPFTTGDTFVLTMTPADALFADGTYTVASRPTATTFTFASIAANGASTSVGEADGGPAFNTVAAFLPTEATTATPVRLYRSAPTSASTITPDDELFLVAEKLPTNTDISNGYIEFTDSTPVSQATDPLYTNPLTGEGADSANFRPPLYRDIAVWNSQTWYLNTTSQQQFTMQMLGVGALDGVQNNDTLTVDGTVFTFKTTVTTADEVLLYTDGMPSANISRTAARLIIIINIAFLRDGKAIRAYSASGQNDPGGKILIERTDWSQTQFAVLASRPESWTPAMTVSVGATAAHSTGERSLNGLMDSKLSQPEAVPVTNFRRIGSKNYPAVRVLPLKNSLIICKAGDGIYALTGVVGNYQTRQISTANVIAPDACGVFADQAWVMTDQGILRISDSGGCQVISRQIETVLNEFQSEFSQETYDAAFFVAYETDRRIYFFVPMAVVDDEPVLYAFMYNNATQAWTGPFAHDCLSGIVGSYTLSAKLFLGTNEPDFATAMVLAERKNFDYLDFAGIEFGVQILDTDEINGVFLMQLASADNVEVGDGVTQVVSGTTWRTKITADRSDLGVGWFAILEDVPFTSGPAQDVLITKHYDVEAQFLPIGDPAKRKSMSRLSWLWKRDSFENADGKTTVLTSEVQAQVEVDTHYQGFGLGGFGLGAFGDPSPIAQNVDPLNVSDAAQFFIGYKTSEVWTKMKMEGFAVSMESSDGPAGRGR